MSTEKWAKRAPEGTPAVSHAKIADEEEQSRVQMEVDNVGSTRKAAARIDETLYAVPVIIYGARQVQ